MATVKKYDLSGKAIGEENFEDKSLEILANPQMIKDYLVAIRKNARQWSANTKGRKEVSCTGRKPHRQKGTGRARQGYYGAPQFRGGGIVFGPKPKFDMHAKINQKEKQKTIRYFIAEKIKSQQLHILKDEKMKEPKTKTISDFLNKLKVSKKRILFLTEQDKKDENFLKSMQNIPKTEFALVSNLNGYNLALCEEVIVLESLVDQIKTLLTKEKA